MRYRHLLQSVSQRLRPNGALPPRVVVGLCVLSVGGGILLPMAALRPHDADGAPAAQSAHTAPAEAGERVIDEVASRSKARPLAEDPAVDPAPAPEPAAPLETPQEPAAEPAANIDVWAAPPAPPASVAGLNATQTKNAFSIVWEGGRMDLPTSAKVIAIATALQESRLLNLASGVIPESQNLPNEGIGYDYDSVGLFQQRPSMGWGSVAECMDPGYSSRAFYSALSRVRGWQHMPVTVAAQKVQGSAFPSAYAKHETTARKIVEELNG